MRRGVLAAVAALIAVSLAAGTALAWVLGTEAGGRWLLARLPMLEVQGFAGHLGGAWRAERVAWRDGERRVTVEAPVLAWRPACLWRATLCVERLEAQAVVLHLPADPDAAPRDGGLPALELPLAVSLRRLDIGPVTLDGTPLIDEAQLTARWDGDGLAIERLRVRREALAVQAEGRLATAGEWATELRLRADLPPGPQGQPWQLAVQASGALQGELALAVQSRGYLEAVGEGAVRPLADDVPAHLAVSAERFLASDALPATLALESVRLALRGDLARGYAVEGSARLPAEEEPVHLALAGRVDTAGARLDALSLDVDEARRVALQGRIDWQDSLRADLSLDWRDFPWQRLYPGEPLPVTLRAAQAQLQYEDGRYLGHFTSRLSGPAGDFTLASPLSGDLEQLHLADLSLEAGQGRARGSLSLGFAEALTWTARLTLDNLDPAYWVAQLPGRLGGTLDSRGRAGEDGLAGEARLALDGRLRGQPARMAVAVEGEGARWALPTLDLRLGDNRLTGSGRWDDTLDGQLELALDRLGQLWPGLSGRLGGSLALAGRATAPSARLRLDGQAVRFQDLRLDALAAQAELLDGERGSLALRASRLASGDLELGELQVRGQGTAAAHELAVDLDGPTLEAALAARGRWQDGAWRGQLPRAEVAAYGQRWALRAPAPLAREADGRVLLGAHCWASGAASLCAEDQRLMPEPQLRYRLRDLPLQQVAALVSPDLFWEGELNADLALDLADAGPRGQVAVDAGSGSLRVRHEDQWLTFAYQVLRLDSRLAPDRVDTELALSGESIGRLAATVRIDPRGPDKPLDGTFAVDRVQLAALRPFVPMLDELAGELAGAGSLAGTLAQPEVRGELRLRDGQVAGAQLPTRLESLTLALRLDGRSARLEGGWRAGAAGQARLAGQLAWGETLAVDLRLDGERLPVVVEPYAELEVAPALRLTFDGQRLALAGRVRVPRGRIEVRELPPATVRVSRDAVIVGEEPAAPKGTPVEMAMDVEVLVGQERLTFSGFGLTAELVGQLHVGDNLDTRGELSLRDGRYRAYGQRLNLRRARLLFTGPIDQPYLDIEAIRYVEEDDVTAGLRITGSTLAPRAEVFSEPAMSQEQALSYLVLGRAPGAGAGDENLLAGAALGLGLAGTSSFTGAVAESLGIRDFQLDTQGTGSTTSVVASGRLTDRLSLRYGVGVFQPSNTLALRYRLTRRLYMEAASGLASSLDLFYRRDF